MSKYKRLTKRDESGKAFVPNKDYRTDRKINGYDDGYFDILDCLAELEDKIENGTLVELPCMQICSKREVVQVIYRDPFFGICIQQFSKAHQSQAEARLKELKGGNI